MKRYLFLLLCFPIMLGAQNGFKKTYSGETTGASFVDVLWDGEKLITCGQFLTDTAPDGALNGFLYMELDTFGNVMHTNVYYEPEDAIVPESGNKLTLLNDSIIVASSQMLFDLRTIAFYYKNGKPFLVKKYDIGGQSAWLLGMNVFDGLKFSNGYIGVGNARFEGVLLKIGANEDIVWQKNFGNPAESRFIGSAVKIQPNRYLLSGNVQGGGSPNSIDYWIKSVVYTIDSSGNVVSKWEGVENEEIGFDRLTILPNGNYLYVTSEFIQTPNNLDKFAFRPKLVCRDSNYNLVWKRYLTDFISPTNFVLARVYPTPDGNFIVIGSWDDYTLKTIAKYTASGENLWTYYDECSPDQACKQIFNGVTVLPSGSIVVSGILDDLEIGKSSALLIKLSPEGCVDAMDCAKVDTKIEIPSVQSSIYPNPTSDFIHIECSNSAMCTVTDITGKVVFESKNQKNHLLDLSSSPEGIYIAHLQSLDGKFSSSYKIVKIK